jgi:hypothetical protein
VLKNQKRLFLEAEKGHEHCRERNVSQYRVGTGTALGMRVYKARRSLPSVVVRSMKIWMGRRRKDLRGSVAAFEQVTRSAMKSRHIQQA